ncbi:unnamed protein product [Coregonus sp. 'balchen']|nr:unnamed protein product [Coregonus sp. 'balchen']
MNLHQVLTGSVNPGDNCFSVGSINNQPFTAYASGCDIVILGSDFERLQIIPGAKHGNIQIAASYGSIVCVFEPVQLMNQKDRASAKRSYQWQKSGQFVLQSIARNLAWDPTDSHLLTVSTSLQLWSNISNDLDEEGELAEMTIGDPQCPWRCIWHCKGSVCNVLLTCGKDSVCRLWAETLLPSDTLLSIHTLSQVKNGQNSDSFKLTGGSKKTPSRIKTQGRNPLESNLQESWRAPLRGVAQPSLTGRLPYQQSTHYNHKTNSVPHANTLCHFHIAASINPATGTRDTNQQPLSPLIKEFSSIVQGYIPLLPSITSLCGGDDEEPGGPFTVHWLNNKELHLTLAMELPAAAVEHQLEVLLEDLNRGADTLFSIHPMDGSLLVWHVDWLDEYHPGMFRQVQVRYLHQGSNLIDISVLHLQ